MAGSNKVVDVTDECTDKEYALYGENKEDFETITLMEEYTE